MPFWKQKDKFFGSIQATLGKYIYTNINNPFDDAKIYILIENSITLI